MLEMELKAVLKNKLQVINYLGKKECEWSRTLFQEDVIYIQNSIEKTVNIPVFRIRKIDGKTVVTLKVQAADLNTARELELEVSDDKIMHQILQIIGFEAKVEVKKKRIETDYRGYKICIDEVEELGDFLEIEKLSEEDSNRETEYEIMWHILEELGIREEDLVIEKYFEMIQKLKR